MEKMYTIKSRWTKYTLQKVSQVDKMYTIKNTLGRQSLHYKKQLWQTNYMPQRVAQMDKIYTIKAV